MADPILLGYILPEQGIGDGDTVIRSCLPFAISFLNFDNV
jgi:hypothetical protein